jgi:CO/xanthine dehydrogenase Mo-binding subunit
VEQFRQALTKRTGKIRVHKVWIAVDGRVLVQPESERNNVERAISYGFAALRPCYIHPPGLAR